MITPDKFGKDHWSTFAYIETRCVDHKGIPNRQHMRCKPTRIAQLNSANEHFPNGNYPTKLKGGVLVYDHDDWDCCDDLEAAGLLEDIGTGLNPCFRLTKLGQIVASQLRAHKADGKNFAEFNWTPEDSVLIQVLTSPEPTEALRDGGVVQNETSSV